MRLYVCVCAECGGEQEILVGVDVVQANLRTMQQSYKDQLRCRLELAPSGSLSRKETRKKNTDSRETETRDTKTHRAQCECISFPTTFRADPQDARVLVGLATRCKNPVATSRQSGPRGKVRYGSSEETYRQIKAMMAPFVDVLMKAEDTTRVKLQGNTCRMHSQDAKFQGVPVIWLEEE